MTSTASPTPAPPSGFRRIVSISMAIIAAIVAAFFLFSNLYADWLWFEQLGFTSVLWTQWLARVVMFAIGFVGMALPVWLSIQFAYRLRPVYARLSAQLDQYQEVIEPLRRLATWGISILFGFFAGFATSAQWEVTWLWFNGVQTADTDPQFGLDTGFYMFALPFYTSVLAYVSAVLLICLLMTAAVSYLYGAVRVGNRELRISKSARIQLAVLAGLYLLVQGVSLWVDQYRTLVEPYKRITGPGYTTVHATIPSLAILAIVAAFVAVLFFVTAVIGRWRFPLIGTALLVVSSLVLGVGYPWVINTIQVKPNELPSERPYFERNMKMTKVAFGIDGLEKTEFAAESEAEAGQLREDAAAAAQIRIMDPAIISPTIRQQEQYRSYYGFADPLDVDRYEIDGESQDTVVSVRELNVDQLGDEASSWQNTALVYTHGYGIVVAKGNDRTQDGFPSFLERGIPAAGFLSDREKFQPRVYFGESSPTYSIVGAPEGTPDVELDYPSGEGGENETKTTFTGDGGPSVGSVFNRLIYSMKFQAGEILFSDLVNEKSQILYDRDPLERVQKVAPYLTPDSDPYPSVVDGRIVWIVDGYTASANYPYSTTVSLSEAIADSNNRQPQFARDDINYIRNSVKATVDAYDGSVTLYAWDDQDPVLQAWRNVYPSTVKPISEMSAELISHVRYPTDLFKVQRAMLGVYHVDDPDSFFRRDNAWETPNDPQLDTQLQPPYYLTMQMPGQDSPTYSMFTSFIPSSEGGNARNVLLGYLAVDSDAGSTAGTKSEDYGTLRMLEIDAETPVPGPGQVKNTFDADPNVSKEINLLKQGQSSVLNGNLLTLPVGGGLLYVMPVYVQSSGATKLPTLKKVLVSFGNDIAFEDTLSGALDILFKGDDGVDVTGGGEPVPDPTPSVDPTTAPTPEPTATPTPGPTEQPGGGQPLSEYDQALQDAQQAVLERDSALKAGDWDAYGAADKKLTDAVERLIELGEQ